jgi:hypothetical protein
MTKRKTSNVPNRKSRNGGRKHAGGRRLLDDALALTSTLVGSRKNASAERLNSLSGATRVFASDLKNMLNLRAYISSAAGEIAKFSNYVRTCDVERLMDDAGRLVRRHPLTTIGVAIAVGFGATQLVLSRSPTTVQKSRYTGQHKKTADRKHKRPTRTDREGTAESA